MLTQHSFHLYFILLGFLNQWIGFPKQGRKLLPIDLTTAQATHKGLLGKYWQSMDFLEGTGFLSKVRVFIF
jgi:hypothetical protein